MDRTETMADFILLHGAWHGGWCWSRVRTILMRGGHSVYTPTFTGLSDRAHLLSPQVNLSTHVEDVVRLIDAEGLTDVILVGHSYAGMVTSAVAEQRPHAISLRVYLDAFLPADGEAAIDLLPESVAHHYRESVSGVGFGWLIPPRSLDVLGVTASDDLEWLTTRLTPHPWASYAEVLSLGGAEASVPGFFIECVSWMRVFAPHADRARSRGWTVYEIETGHEAMVTGAIELAHRLNLLAR
jgi:pimeloyl-ACP methyl ester carboxylesterase